MYKLIFQKAAHFLSAQMAELSTFLQIFIVLGIYNFDPFLDLVLSICITAKKLSFRIYFLPRKEALYIQWSMEKGS